MFTAVDRHQFIGAHHLLDVQKMTFPQIMASHSQRCKQAAIFLEGGLGLVKWSHFFSWFDASFSDLVTPGRFH